MTASTKVQWRVQVRVPGKRWIKAGLFETRERARQESTRLRAAYGMRNTRVVRYVRGEK